MIDTFSGKVQFYFTYTINLPTGSKMHQLAFVKWYQSTPNPKTRFYCKANDNNDEGCNVKLWKNEYHKANKDNIISIYNIFVLIEFVVGICIPKTYMAVTLINRQFYL